MKAEFTVYWKPSHSISPTMYGHFGVCRWKTFCVLTKTGETTSAFTEFVDLVNFLFKRHMSFTMCEVSTLHLQTRVRSFWNMPEQRTGCDRHGRCYCEYIIDWNFYLKPLHTLVCLIVCVRGVRGNAQVSYGYRCPSPFTITPYHWWSSRSAEH